MQVIKEEKKIYWSPAVFWREYNEKLKIEMFIYDEFALKLFPKFFYLTQKGITQSELLKEFDEKDKRKISLFIKDLLKKKILVTGLLTPQEVFFPQNRMFESEYGDELLFDAEALRKFKKKQLGRVFDFGNDEKIYLDNEIEYPKYIRERKSYRRFDESREIPFKDFSTMLSILKQICEGEKIRYYYASAGGLYPIDVFIYVKKNRIENVSQGVYYYNPIENCLQVVNKNPIINSESHFFVNKDIFESSAFSLYFFYNANATMPKYKSDGYFYGCLDTGIMVSTLTQAAEQVNIGLCSIGEMNFKKISKYFKLNDRQIYLHTIEAGLKLEENK